jgi:hypothetical protein
MQQQQPQPHQQQPGAGPDAGAAAAGGRKQFINPARMQHLGLQHLNR